MLYVKCLFLCVSWFVIGTHGALAPFITPCKWDDPNCILKSAKAAQPHIVFGIPELKVPSADPMKIDDVVADSGDFKLTLKNMTVVGLSKCNIMDVSREEIDKATGHIAMYCPFNITGNYVMSGELLFVPAQGEGPFEIKTDKLLVIVDLNFKKFNDKEGKEHYKVKDFEYKYNLINKVNIKLENLFNGDKTQGDPVLDLWNQNWREIIDGFGATLFKEVISKSVHVIDTFFRKVPTEELQII